MYTMEVKVKINVKLNIIYQAQTTKHKYEQIMGENIHACIHKQTHYYILAELVWLDLKTIKKITNDCAYY